MKPFFWVSELLNRGLPQWSIAYHGNRTLQSLAKDLLAVLSSARATSTTNIYSSAYKKWVSWCRASHIISFLPAVPQHAALYLVHLGRGASSFSVLNLARSAIAWGHSLGGFEPPTKNLLVQETLPCLKFRLAKPAKKKKPFTLGQIRSLIGELDQKSLLDCWNTCMLELAFYAFFRNDELAHVKAKNIQILTIQIERSKNDQLHQGSEVVVSKLGLRFCPVLSNARLFRTHSMRAGGSTAAANAGVNDRSFQKHGRWHSVVSKDGYVKNDIQKREY